MSKRKSKKKCQLRHAKMRALQRYGVEIDIDAAIKTIQSGHARLIEKQSLRVTVWEIEQEGQKMPVVYDKLRQSIATVLPREYMDNFKPQGGAQ